jgi:hypothetical protein
MKKYTFLGLFLISLFAASLSAQSKPNKNPTPKASPKTSPKAISRESLMQDPNVLWIGEAQSLILLDATEAQMLDAKYLEACGLINQTKVAGALIKFMETSAISSSPYDSELGTIRQKLLKQAFFDKNEVYTDAACTQKLPNPKQKISVKDTVITFDPNTFQEIVTVIVNELDIDAIKCFKINHLVYFDQKMNSFGTLVTALAPVSETLGKPLFWVKIENLANPKDLTPKEITWAKRISRNFTFAGFKSLKNSKTVEECLQMHIDFIAKNAKTVDIRSTMGQLEKLNPAEIAKIAASEDTIITFDHKTFKEIVQVITNNLEPKDLKKLRFLQEWYWDDKLQKISTHSRFYAPIIQRYDDNGNFLNEGPMFWTPAAN